MKKVLWFAVAVIGIVLSVYVYDALRTAQRIHRTCVSQPDYESCKARMVAAAERERFGP